MLKILHTADWHLGHSLHGVSRDYEQQCFLRWLLEQLEQLAANVLIIAGDVFDSANPPASAQSALYDFLVQARQRNLSLQVILIGGNHDSAARLDAPAQILQSLGISVIGGLTRLEDGNIDWQRLIVPLMDKTGTVRAVCGAMPFIRNADLPEIRDAENNNDPLISGVTELYRQLTAQMQHYKKEQGLDEGIGQILTGHCYMVGGELSELSERRILGGNQHALPASLFDPLIDYVALGHLHKAQRVKSAQKCLIHYSGSPIPLSFAEKNYRHRIVKIEFPSIAEKVTAEPVFIPRSVELQILPEQGYATLIELESLIAEQNYAEVKKIAELKRDDLDKTDLDKTEYPLLEVCIELDKPEPDLRQQIEKLLQDKAVRLLKITTHYPGKGQSLAEQKQQKRLEELHPEEVFQQCYQRFFEQQAPRKMMEAFHHLLESVEVKE